MYVYISQTDKRNQTIKRKRKTITERKLWKRFSVNFSFETRLNMSDFARKICGSNMQEEIGYSYMH